MSAIVLDTETTGFVPGVDRVIELAILKYDTYEVLFHRRFNPGITIPEDAIRVHGITNADVANESGFSEFACEIASIVADAEAVIGYNVMFDRNMIVGEFKKLGESFVMPRWPTLVCAKRLWDMHEPKRNQMAAYRRFVDKAGFKGAHGALADVDACYAIVKHQLREFSLLDKPWHELDPEQKLWYGPTEHLIWNDGCLVVNFGKNKGTPAHVVDRSFWKWLCDKDFPEHVKQIADWMLHCAVGNDGDRYKLTEFARRQEAKL